MRTTKYFHSHLRWFLVSQRDLPSRLPLKIFGKFNKNISETLVSRFSGWIQYDWARTLWQPIVRPGSDYWLVPTVLSPPPSLPLRLRKYPGATHQRREKRKNFGNFLQRNNRNNKRNNKISSIARMSEATATAPYLFFYLFLSLFHLHHHIFIWFHKSLTENENKLNSLSSSLKERKKTFIKTFIKEITTIIFRAGRN